MSTPSKTVVVTYVKDLTERIIMTWAQAFLGTLVVSGFFSVDAVTNLSIAQRAAVAGVAAVLVLIKGLIVKAFGIGDPATAGLVTIHSDRRG